MNNIYDNIFPLGLGTNRFNVKNANDDDGIEKAVSIVEYALESGVNYIDAAANYSNATAHIILKQAFAKTKKPYCVTIKSKSTQDKSESDIRKRVETSFESMGIDFADFFIHWFISNYSEFKQIISKGGAYETAERLKNEGLIKHITASVHAPVDDIIKIIKSRAFEGITVSFSLLNGIAMQPVLETAEKFNVPLLAMNPLGGGIIPANEGFFSFANANEDESVSKAALRYVNAHNEIKVTIAGPSSIEELKESLLAFTGENIESNENRIKRIELSFRSQNNYCVGCNYCEPCPSGIPVSDIMKCRNSLLFESKSTHNRADVRVVQNINLLGVLERDFSFLPDTAENPCIDCKECEIKCTQKLKITDAVADTYERAKISGFSEGYREKRLGDLLKHGYKKVGFYPSGGYTSCVLQHYEKYFGAPDFNVIVFDSNAKLWGKTVAGFEIHSPEEIKTEMPDIILVSTYKFSDEIYNDLQKYSSLGIKIEKLHREADIPWLL